ncbi:hypothetical protein [Martelella mediterranea]|uniref:hypothetical protein n=1 Tax=Martelella mediterranea TaxID=293089 RepID=UPI0010439826|nr:hypothetical protein [Martelella mediterranea]
MLLLADAACEGASIAMTGMAVIEKSVRCSFKLFKARLIRVPECDFFSCVIWLFLPNFSNAFIKTGDCDKIGTGNGNAGQFLRHICGRVNKVFHADAVTEAQRGLLFCGCEAEDRVNLPLKRLKVADSA